MGIFLHVFSDSRLGSDFSGLLAGKDTAARKAFRADTSTIENPDAKKRFTLELEPSLTNLTIP